MRKGSPTPGDGTALIVVLLALCLAAVISIAWQAHATARSHHRMAVEILRDYAVLAADEMVQRSAGELR